MSEYQWIDAFSYNNINLPIVIEKDNEYFPLLQQYYQKILEDLNKSKAPDCVIKLVEKYSSQLTNAIDSYYKGDIITAHTIIFELFEDCCNDNEYAISDINNSIAFPTATNENKGEVQFFRARLNESVIDYKAKDMLHIPFNKRSIVKSERFSIPGLPCIYLGNTSYICWLELGRPADFRFNVSPVLLDNTQRIFNLTVFIKDISSITKLPIEEEEKNRKLKSLLKLYLLNFATSFHVLEQGRNFKSEYIIPQLLLLACKNKGLNGLAYHSKQVEHELFSMVLGVNLVLFADYNGEHDLSKICEHIEIGDSMNFSMFKQLLPSLLYKDYNLRIDWIPFNKSIGTFERQFPYNETQFYYFDKYLFANWNRMFKIKKN